MWNLLSSHLLATGQTQCLQVGLRWLLQVVAVASCFLWWHRPAALWSDCPVEWMHCLQEAESTVMSSYQTVVDIYVYGAKSKQEDVSAQWLTILQTGHFIRRPCVGSWFKQGTQAVCWHDSTFWSAFSSRQTLHRSRCSRLWWISIRPDKSWRMRQRV